MLAIIQLHGYYGVIKGESVMPPLGERFQPTTELTTEEQRQKAEINAKKAELGAIMEGLTPPFKEGRFRGRWTKSAVAYYEHPDLPDGQLMEAYLERVGYGGGEPYIKLDARPVYARNHKAVSHHASDTRAYTSERGTAAIQINAFFAEGNFDGLGHAQKLEAIGQVVDTLQLIAAAAVHRAVQEI